MGLETVEIVMWAEEAFDISLPDEEVSEVYTVGEFASLIARKVNERHNKNWSYREPLPLVIDVLVNDYGVQREKISTVSRIVDDLGLE